MAVEQHIIELIPEYVLGLLDPVESQQVEQHLQACAACREEEQAHRQVVGLLAYSAPQKDPSSKLRQRILQVPGTQAIQATEKPIPNQFWQKLAHFFGSPSPGWVALTVFLFAAWLLSALLLGAQIYQLRAELARQSPLQVIALKGTESAPEATGVLIVSVDGTHGALVVDRLPKLDEANEYQLWLIRDDHRESGGVFSVGKSGYGVLYVSSEEPLSSYPSFGITIEPAGGSPGPTGEKVLGGDL
jgi:anti-sigma-K factor RskA